MTTFEPPGVRLSPFPPGSTSLQRSWLRRLVSLEASVSQATIMLMASFLMSAVLGSLQQILFNAHFGAGGEASAFYAALRLRDLFFALIAGRVVSSAVIPVLASSERQARSCAHWRLTDLVLTSLLAALALFVFVCELTAPAIVSTLLAPGFDQETKLLTVQLTRIVLVQPLILAVSAVAIAVLNSRNQFLLTALSLVAHNLGIIGGVVASWALPGLGIMGPTLGVIAGAVLQVIILLPGLRGLRFTYRPGWDLSDPHLREAVGLLVPIAASAGLGYSGFVLDTAFASFAREPAAVPAIYNAWLLAGLPVSLLGKAVSQSVFPQLARHAAVHDWTGTRRTLLRALTVAATLAIPALLALIILGRQAIRLLFEHGRFDESVGSLTYAALAMYAVALPTYVAIEVLVRGLIAVRDTRSPLVGDICQLIGRASIMGLLLGRIGVLAVPIAFAAMASIEAVALLIMFLFRIRQRLNGPAEYATAVL